MSCFSRAYAAPFLALTILGFANPPALRADDAPAAVSAEKLAELIDASLRSDWKQNQIEPAPRTTDSEFVRRVFLNLIGRIPSVAEGRAFLENESPDKRRQLIDELLQRGAFAAHLANTWRDLLLAGTNAADVRASARGLENWLRLRFAANMPYDQLATELLTAAVDRGGPRTSDDPSPLAFYQAAEFKPEVLAASASRVFLGVQVQCAQCHDHPFTEWKQPQFWSFAALFQDLDQQNPASADGDGIKIPEKDVLVPAAFLDGSRPEGTGLARRQSLARWTTSPRNPYFARAVVNRIWAHCFGQGFVDPVDDLDPANAPSHPELFDAVVEQFIRSGYDLKYLVRSITYSEAWQLSSRGAAGAAGERQIEHFARMPLRRMTSDQLFASFVEATGFRDAVPQTNNIFQPDNGARMEFQSKFGDPNAGPTETETTILQALSLMNGKFVAQATDLEQSETLAAIVEAPFLDTAGRIESLYLTALSRRPEPEETTRLSAWLERRSKKVGEKAALADLFWTLLNSAEFLLNH